MKTMHRIFLALLFQSLFYSTAWSQLPQLSNTGTTGPNLTGITASVPLFPTTTTTLPPMSLSVFHTASDPTGHDPTIGQPINPIRENAQTFEVKTTGLITAKVVAEYVKRNLTTAAIPQVISLKLVNPNGQTVDSIKNISLLHTFPKEFTLRGSANATTSGCTANNVWKVVMVAGIGYSGLTTANTVVSIPSPEREVTASPTAGYALVTNQAGDFTFKTPTAKSGKVTITVTYSGGSIPVEMQLLKPGAATASLTRTSSGTATYTFNVENTDQPTTTNSWKIKLTNKGAQLIQNAKVKVIFSECR